MDDKKRARLDPLTPRGKRVLKSMIPKVPRT